MARTGDIRSSKNGVKTANTFSALQTSSAPRFKPLPTAVAAPQQEQRKTAVAWTQKPGRSWADYENEDDDEFFAHVAPLRPVLTPPTAEGNTREKAKEEGETADGQEEEDEEEEAAEEEKLSGLKTLRPVQKPMKAIAPLQPALTKKEQRRRELAEIDCVLAEPGSSQGSMAPKAQWVKKLQELEQAKLTPYQDQFSQKPKASGTVPTGSWRYRPKEEIRPLAQEMDAGEACRGAIDHAALRKVAASASSQKGNMTKTRSSSCAASSSLSCPVAPAETGARAAKVVVAKKKKRSKQQSRYPTPR